MTYRNPIETLLAFNILICNQRRVRRTLYPPSVLPHPREDGTPPPPGGQLPNDAPPPPPGEPHYHCTRTFSGTEIALQKEGIQWQDCFAFTLIRDMHHCAYPTTCAKTGSPVERMNITFLPRLNMAVLSSSVSAKVSKMSCQEYKGYRWQCLTTQSPTQQHTVSRNKKICVDQVPRPPFPGDKRGGGQGRGGTEYAWCKQHHECLMSRASSVSPPVSHPSFFHTACSTAYRCWARGAGEKQRRGGGGGRRGHGAHGHCWHRWLVHHNTAQ